jgi:2-phospho-L-lactate guanylyltransferase (CobY/MobA/RfbA family)
VLSFPLHSDFHTAYGPGSLDNHIHIAQGASLSWEIIADSSLELDLDTADDLSEFEKRKKEMP